MTFSLTWLLGRSGSRKPHTNRRRPLSRPRLEELEDRLALNGSISGQVFEDLNNDGTRGASEPGLNGWQVQLLDSAGQVVRTAVSADVDRDGDQVIDPVTESGLYQFADVPPGDYVVQQVMPEGWRQTFPNGVLRTDAEEETTANLASPPEHHPPLPPPPHRKGRDLLPDLGVDTVNGLSDWLLDGNTLRFSMATPNIGRGRMELRGGPVQPDGRQLVYQRIYRRNGGHIDRPAGYFTYHPEHGHIHFDGYAEYNLREMLPDGSVGPVVASGQKISFCLLDVERATPRPAHVARRHYRDCNAIRQGISPGWMDVYDSGLEGQSIDVTNVLPGRYWLEAVVDPTNALVESDETNNIGRVPIRIPLVGRAGTYVVSIAADEVVEGRDFGNFLSGVIGGQVFEDHNGDGQRDPDVDQGLPDRVVFADLNGNGAFDEGEGTFDSPDVPRTIPDVSTIHSTLTLSNVGAVVDLNVKLTIRHTFDADLTVYLVSPAGTRVLLFGGVGGSSNNFVDTVLDDEAAKSSVLDDSKAPFTGLFRPQESLSAFDGENANGVWTLEVSDTAGGDDGTLMHWSLALTHEEPHAHTDEDGNYRFTGLELGTYHVFQMLPDGWSQTTPDAGLLQVTASGAAFTGIDFGAHDDRLAPGPQSLAADRRATTNLLGSSWFNDVVDDLPAFRRTRGVSTSFRFQVL